MGEVNHTTTLKRLRVTGLAGCVLFSALLALTANQEAVERGAQAFIQSQIEREIRDMAELAQSIPGGLDILSKRYGADLQRTMAALDDDLPARIAEQVAALCRLDCAGQELVEQTTKGFLENRAEQLKTAQDTLNSLIRSTYFQVLERLIFDLRLFLATNAVAFLFVAGLTFIPGRLPRTVLLPSGLLLVVTVAGCLMYAFGQDWFYTIVFGSYWGLAYAGWLAVVYGLCIDVAFNKGRVVTAILNLFGTAASNC